MSAETMGRTDRTVVAGAPASRAVPGRATGPAEPTGSDTVAVAGWGWSRRSVRSVLPGSVSGQHTVHAYGPDLVVRDHT